MALAIVTCLALVFAALLLRSGGTPLPIVDAAGHVVPGSISEKVFVDVNGVQQGMFIQSRDPRNPVLLFLHGGPGMPEYFLTERHPTGLEDDFTVVWWDERGAGLSYGPGLDRASLTLDQLVDDTITLTDYLRMRFNQDRIYLMGHSGGSFVGILAAARAPERYAAYVGMGQMSFQLASEVRAYDYMVDAYRERGDTRMVERLTATPPTTNAPLPAAYAAVRDDAMHRLGIGTTRAMRSVVTGVFVPSWLSPQYTLGEKLRLWQGKVFSSRALRDPMFATDLTQLVTRLAVPTYFLSGRWDYTCNADLAREFLTTLEAPVKGFYTFEGSAHSPLFEEPERVRDVLLTDVLTGTTTMADVSAR